MRPVPRRSASAQSAAYANLVRVPFSNFSYALGPTVTDTEAQAAARRTFGSSARVVRLSLRYALRGIDARPTSHDLWWTFVRQPGRPSPPPTTPWPTPAAPAGWGRGTSARSRSCVADRVWCSGRPRSRRSCPASRPQVDAAIPAVTAVWGTSWTRRVAVEVAGSDAALTAELDASTPVTRGSGISALAVSDGTDTLSGLPIGQRLVVDPLEYSRLSDVGRRITVTHELTHIAAAAATGAGTPRWLVEGFAEYVGNLHSGQPVPTAARELRGQVRAGRVPAALPTVADLGGVGRRRGLRVVLAGVPADRATRGRAGPGAAVPHRRRLRAAHRRRGRRRRWPVLHTTTPAFTAQWRAYLRAQLR